MDVIRLVQFVQKTIKGRRQSVREILENNGVQSMEQYQKLMGELDALFYVEEELTSFFRIKHSFWLASCAVRQGVSKEAVHAAPQPFHRAVHLLDALKSQNYFCYGTFEFCQKL